MLLIIPLLKLKNGKSLLAIKGKESTDDYYRQLSENPVKLCKLIRSENFKTIHIDIVDYIENNFDVIKFIVDSLDIPVQVRANFQSINQCRNLLDNGVYRIIINDLIIKENNEIKEMIKEYTPSRIVAAVFSENRLLKLENLEISYELNDYIKILKKTGVQRIVYSLNKLIITPKEINSLKQFLEFAKMRTTIYGGVDSPEILWELDKMSYWGIDSVILNESLYSNKFPCQKMWREIEGKLQSYID